MKRKIIKLAEKTLVVSLPSDWIQTQGLTKGDELDVAIEDYKLVITPPQNIVPHKSIELDVKDMSERVLRWSISSLHKKGYDEIIVINYTEEQNKIVEELVQNLFVGFIIKEKSRMRIVVGQVAAVDVAEFDTTLRRAFRQVEEMFEHTKQAIEQQNPQLLQEQILAEQTNNKLTNFCERLLNKYLKQKELGHFWYVLAWNLEKVADNFKYIANHYTEKLELSNETKEAYTKLTQFAKQYLSILYNFSMEELVELAKEKKVIEKELLQLLEQAPSHDRIFIHYLHMIVLQLADFSASIIAIKYTPNI